MILVKLDGGLTNEVYLKVENGEKSIVRIYCSEMLISEEERKLEEKIMEKIYNIGLCPRILKIVKNGREEEFINYEVLRKENIDCEIFKLIADKVSIINGIDFSHDNVLIMRLQRWWEIIRNAYSGEIVERISLLYDFYLDFLKKHEENNKTYLCHGDLNPGNIMINYKSDSKDIKFIDWEYSGHNFREFEYLHFLIELRIDNDNLKFTNSFQELESYIFEILKVGNKITLENIKYFKNVIHLFWAMWGLIQKIHRKNKDYYYNYTVFRLELIE